MAPKITSARAENSKRYYEKHKDRIKATRKTNQKRTNISNQRNRSKKYEYIAKIKESRPCADCCLYFPAIAMDFDHVCGKKFANIGDLVGRCASLEVIDAEIAKCDVVCATCHRLRTRFKQGFPVSMEVRFDKRL